jgi:hypothetical protein
MCDVNYYLWSVLKTAREELRLLSKFNLVFFVFLFIFTVTTMTDNSLLSVWVLRLARSAWLAWLLWWLAIALHWLLTVALHGLTVALHWLAISLHGLSTITLWLLSTGWHNWRHSILLGLTVAWLLHRLAWLLHWCSVPVHHLLLLRHAGLSSGWLTSISGWGIGRWSTGTFFDQVVLLKITAELVVTNTLLELDQDVIQLHVELSSLLEQDGELLLNDDGFIDLLEELVFGWVVANLSNCSIQGS